MPAGVVGSGGSLFSLSRHLISLPFADSCSLVSLHINIVLFLFVFLTYVVKHIWSLKHSINRCGFVWVCGVLGNFQGLNKDISYYCFYLSVSRISENHLLMHGFCDYSSDEV